MESSTERQSSIDARCLATVAACNQHQRWGLDAAACRRYAADLARLLPADADDDLAYDVALNYHADHQAVAALRQPTNPEHERAWARWMQHVLLILRREGLAWPSDRAVADEDLAQIAAAELARALPSYRYQSRLSTWAYRVIVQVVRRHARDGRRAKRALRPDSLDQLAEANAPLPAAAPEAEQAAHARLLYQLIMGVLAEQPDDRLGKLFHLAEVEDRSVAEIGALVHLSEPRVRALLQQIRQLLRGDPAIRAWAHGEAGPQAPSDPYGYR